MMTGTEFIDSGREEEEKVISEEDGVWVQEVEEEEEIKKPIQAATGLQKKPKDNNIDKLQLLLKKAQTYSKFLQDQLKSASSYKDATSSSKSSFKQSKLVDGGSLRDYQLQGVQWLISLYENGLNGILADEMGLGKTIQSIAFISFLVERGVNGPFLVVAPLSTLDNWQSEFSRWSPTLKIAFYHGNKKERMDLTKELFHGAKKKGEISWNVMITSYEIIMKDLHLFMGLNWKYLIVDEGHRLKNMNCRLILELKQLKTDNRLILTGTPLQNNLAELWSLLNFLMPEIFNDVDEFLDWFENVLIVGDGGGASVEIIAKLHQILKPVLLRRLKSDVERSLPSKREHLIQAPLAPLQMQYYKSILKRGTLKLDDDGMLVVEDRDAVNDEDQDQDQADSDDSPRPSKRHLRNASSSTFSNSSTSTCPSVRAVSVQNKIMQLRKVCNHPWLFHHPGSSANKDILEVDQRIISTSGKMIILDKILFKLLKSPKKSTHKILIFSQMSKMLDLLGDYLSWRSWAYSRIDGSVSQTERKKEIKKFDQDPEIRVFLLSTRAGGLGINLTAADTVIFYDSDWNPQMDLQAQDRVHRIGQIKPVLILRLACTDSVEIRMLERANKKRQLEHWVIHKRKFKNIGGEGEEGELKDDDLLKVLGDLPKIQAHHHSTDIESILKRG